MSRHQSITMGKVYAFVDDSGHADICNQSLRHIAVRQTDINRLRFLNCNGNLLTNLDAFRLCPIEVINCSNNQLTDLNACTNWPLRRINCSNNEITAMPQLPNATMINCAHNNLRSLHSNSACLVDLDCAHNQIETMTIDAPFLSRLDCSFNSLTKSTAILYARADCLVVCDVALFTPAQRACCILV